MTTTPTPTSTDAAPESSFATLGLAEPILRAVQAAGYETPTAVQAIAIPLALSGRDLLASAQTGTGKTAAFVLPTLQRLSETEGDRGVTRALILTPTRELAEQVEAAVRTYGGHLRLRTALLVGGMPYGPQIGALRRGADLVVATPGRLLDHLDRGDLLRLDTVETFVLDEADRMLDMGFQPDLARLAEVLPAKRQTLMFSATIPREVEKLAHSMLSNPERIEIGERRSPAATVTQRVVTVTEGDKMRLLLHLLRTGEGLAAGAEPTALVFTKTKIRADEVAEFLMADGVPVGLLHGDRSQIQRRRALENFRNGRVAVLVATDVAARGIDVPGLDIVVNFDAPMAPEDYIHRIGQYRAAPRRRARPSRSSPTARPGRCATSSATSGARSSGSTSRATRPPSRPRVRRAPTRVRRAAARAAATRAAAVATARTAGSAAPAATTVAAAGSNAPAHSFSRGPACLRTRGAALRSGPNGRVRRRSLTHPVVRCLLPPSLSPTLPMRRLLPLAVLAAALTIPAAAQPSFQWARAWGGTGAEYGYGLAIAPGGDVFVAGSFAAGVRFGPDSLVSAGSADILLMRLAPDGTVRWARRAGSNRADFAYAVETGPNGSVYVGGTFTRSIGFGSGDSLYANGNNRDAFVARYTGDGVYEWGWTGGGVANDDYLRDFVVEPDGGFYAAGDFHTAATIGGGVVQSAGLGDAWLARVRPDRSLAWIRTGGGTSDEDTWRTVAAAPGGGVYVAGTFRTRAGYTDPSRPTADTLVSRGSTDIAAARYGADGRLLWTRSMGGGSADFAFDGAAMTDGDFVFAGILGTSGGVFGSETLTTAGKSDALAVRLSPDGDVRWVRLAGGPEDDSWRAAAALPGGAALVAGNLNTPSTVGAVPLVTQGGSDLVAADDQRRGQRSATASSPVAGRRSMRRIRRRRATARST